MCLDRTEDYRRVKRFRIPSITNKVYYLIESKGGSDVGLWTLEPHHGRLYIHADMGSRCRGKDAVRSAKAAFDWVFRNTDFDEISASISNSKRDAQLMAVWSGMKFVGSGADRRNYLVRRSE